jgi:hypothetical protein
MVPDAMQKSEAFQSLSAPAIRLLLRCLFKNYGAATNRSRGTTGKPTFRLTNAEAKEHLRMSSDKFSRAKDELARKGFLEWFVRGGMRGCNGVASEFMLSGEWKGWTRSAEAIEKKARAILNLKSSSKNQKKNA